MSKKQNSRTLKTINVIFIFLNDFLNDIIIDCYFLSLPVDEVYLNQLVMSSPDS